LNLETMRASQSITLLFGTLLAVACGDSPDPFSPESVPTPSFSAAAVTSFTATTIATTVIDEGITTFTGNAVHIRGQVVEGPLTGDLGVGTFRATVNFDADAATFRGSGRGTLTLFLAGGTYEGPFAGKTNGPVFSFHFQAHGTGAFGEMKIQGTATDEADPTNEVFVLTGRHVDPSP
jgi:hypothetical protein